MFKADERTAGLYTITVTQFALVFMLSAVAVAVPALGREFGASASQLGLVESGYISAVAMLLFPVTKLADKIGRGATFAMGVLLFTIVSFVLPMCTSMDQFIILRVFQGCGGAMLVSTGLAILADLYPGPGRAKALGIASAGVYLGLSAGPWLGGMIVTHWGWRWVFWAGGIPCALVFLLSLKTLPVRPVITKGIRFDPLGAILIALGMIFLSQGGSQLHNPTGQIMLAGGIVALIAFVLWENRAKSPLLDMKLFRSNPSFSLGSAVQFISYSATFGVTFLISLYLQISQGMTASEAGIVLMAQPLMQVIFSLVSGNWCERWAPHKVATIGMGLATLGLGAAIFLGNEVSILHVVVLLGLCGAGSAIFATANMAVIMGAVEKQHYGVASAVVAAMRTTGMTVSLVFISGVFAIIIGPHALHEGNAPVYVEAMHVAFIALTIFSASGVIMSARARMKKRNSDTPAHETPYEKPLVKAAVPMKGESCPDQAQQ
ncbi:MFS transporter [Pseudodesulfovibrio sp. zrk46]|uniref:MFS transporter n=1 Tax=Pseudodesulfovibrio sp. zrk46 TaxID=2725288 RepID=UPI001448CF2F|nr:MFS transporter [Pseudodesulfovibrio sp. zrk46]QJB55092.1 MFS transporter [Pseudodesulfovibrio sp. zrk46]